MCFHAYWLMYFRDYGANCFQSPQTWKLLHFLSNRKKYLCFQMVPNHDHISGRWTQYSVRNFGWVHWLHTLDETALFVISKYINGKPSRVYLMLGSRGTVHSATVTRHGKQRLAESQGMQTVRFLFRTLRFLSPGSLGWCKYGNLDPALCLCR